MLRALTPAQQRERVASYVDAGSVAFRGSAPDGPGYWFPPTVLTGLAEDSPALTEEMNPTLSWQVAAVQEAFG